MNQRTMAGRLLTVVLTTALLLAAGCGSSADEATTTDDPETEVEVATGTEAGDDEVATETEAADGGDEAASTVTVNGEDLELVTIEPESGVELVDYTTSAMGGFRFSVNPEHYLVTTGDTIAVSITSPDSEPGWESASVGLVTQTASGEPMASTTELIDHLAAVPSAEITPTGTAIELLGHQLVGYDLRADASTKDLYSLAADRLGSPVNAVGGFFPNGRLYMADTPAGVLVAGVSELDDPADIAVVEPTLGTLLATLEATGTGFDQALPPGESLEPDVVEVSQARGPADPEGPISLDASFASIKPDTYQVRNFGQTFTVDVGEGWWVQPNSAGFVALSSPRNGGPGERDMRFVTGIVDLVPVAGGPVAVGDPIPLTTADEVIEALGDTLEVSGVEQVDLGGAAATRFDVRTPDGAACSQDDPCGYAFRARSGVILLTQPAHHHRIWWLEDGAEGPSMILAMAPDGDGFVDRATELLATLRFNDS